MRVLVTGSSGFIGRHLERALNEAGHTVYPLDLAYSAYSGYWGPWRSQDIRDEKAMIALVDELAIVGGTVRPGVWDACVHLAAIAAPDKCKADPQLAWETNVRGTWNVLRLCQQANIRKVVFMSSAHVYGISPKYLPTPEVHPLYMHDTYTVTKIVGESICELFWANHGIAYTTLRLYNCYGPGQSPDYFLGVKMRQAKAGGPITIRNRAVAKDWVEVGDVVRAIMLALESKYVGPVNIGTGQETPLGHLVNRIAKAFDLSVIGEQDDVSGPSRMRADVSRAKTVLGWEPRIWIDEGLDALIKATKEAT
jgi:nucleoside-diphosphate-sugar epimerase